MKKIILSLAISLLAMPQISAMDDGSNPLPDIIAFRQLMQSQKKNINTAHLNKNSELKDAAVVGGILVGICAFGGLVGYVAVKVENYRLKNRVNTLYTDFKVNSQLLAPVYEYIKETALSIDGKLSETDAVKIQKEMLTKISELLAASHTETSALFTDPLEELKYYTTALELSITALGGWRVKDHYDLLKDTLGNVSVDPKVYVAMELNEAAGVKKTLKNFCALYDKSVK